MTAEAIGHRGLRRRDPLIAAGALLGLAAAVAVRVSVAGVHGSASWPAGVVFGGFVALLALLLGMRLSRPTVRDALLGTAAAVVLCVAPAARSLAASHHVVRADGFGRWALVVAFVAVAEELLLRGALFEALRRWRGPATALAVTSVAFGLLHVPVYGWHVLVLDVAVGVLLGGLRLIADSVWAPAFAHTLADLAGWWLR